MLKLSISNIAWSAKADEEMYQHMKYMGYSGLEIAPSRIFGTSPYEKIQPAADWSSSLFNQYGLSVSSIQSIWYGKKENLFRSNEELEALIAYTSQAVQFANAIHCNNLVFGCPQNRKIETERADTSLVAVNFFHRLGNLADKYNTRFGIEANPPIYGTNFLNTTQQVIDMILQLQSPRLGLNLDLGTIISNQEDIENIQPFIHLITHVHISEPGLSQIKERQLHRKLLQLLQTNNYNGYVSIEMKNYDSVQAVLNTMSYLKEVASDVEP